MPFSFNGFGTRFYGQRELRSDYSYITTVWIVFLYLPVLPIRSLRVKGDYDPIPRFGMTSSEYVVLKKGFPNWKQVLCVYGFVLSWGAWAAVVVWIALAAYGILIDHEMPNAALIVSTAIMLGLTWLPTFVPERLRKRAEQKAGVNGYEPPHV